MHNTTSPTFLPATPSADQNQAPGSGHPGIQIGSLIYAGFVAMLYFGLMCLHLFVMPRFTAIFSEFGTDLPWLTAHLIAMPVFLVACAYLLVIGILIAKEFPSFIDVRIRLTVNTCALFLAPLIFATYVIGLFLPLMQLMEETM